MTSVDLILYESGDHVARIMLNRPEKRNALNAELMAGLLQALDRAAADQEISVIVLSGAGKDFCAGMDLAVLDRGTEAGPLDHIATAQKVADVLLALRRHRCPIIAAVHGRALAGGAGIASACDLILATESSSIGYPEVNIGFVPAMVAPLLRRSVNEKRAFELLVSGTPISATEAHAAGLFNHVYADDQFAAQVDAYARNLAQKSATAMALTKSLLYHVDGMALERGIEAGVQMNALSRGTADAQRGFAKFVKKSS